MSNDYIDPTDAGFLQQLLAFESIIPTYASALGLTSAQLTAHSSDTAYFGYVTGAIEVMRNANTQWTAWRDITRDGAGPGTTTTEADVPELPSPATPVPPGIEPRFRALANLIKANPNYNDAMGKALGIVREAAAAPDLSTVQPLIAAKLDGDAVRVSWNWGKNGAHLDQCEIQVDRADGRGFILLTIDTTPGYIDTHPFPATATKWTYRAIYRLKDRQAGTWSNPVTVLVSQA